MGLISRVSSRTYRYKMSANKPTKTTSCRTRILNVFKYSHKQTMAINAIISLVQTEYKHEYKNREPIKTAFRELLADKTLIHSPGYGLRGSVKLNPENSTFNSTFISI